jgi:hypothetical protein
LAGAACETADAPSGWMPDSTIVTANAKNSTFLTTPALHVFGSNVSFWIPIRPQNSRKTNT